MLEIPIDPFLDAFVQMYHFLSILSALQFRIIRFVSDHGAARSCCCKLAVKHKEDPMVLATDLNECLLVCRDHLRPSYLADLGEKAYLPIERNEKFKFAKSSAKNLYYSLQDIKVEMKIIFENLTDVVDILRETDPSLMLWEEFRSIVPDKIDLLISNLSQIMTGFSVELQPLPSIQLGHRYFFETGRVTFKKRCEKLTESMLRVHATGYHPRLRSSSR